jgi:hypothetical protein
MLMALAQVRIMFIYQVNSFNAFCCADIAGEVHKHAPKRMHIHITEVVNKTIDKTLRGVYFEQLYKIHAYTAGRRENNCV